MSAKKQKEAVEKKQKTDEPKIVEEFENLQEVIESEIAADSTEQPEVDSVQRKKIFWKRNVSGLRIWKTAILESMQSLKTIKNA